MSQPPTKIFDSETSLPDPRLDARAKTLLGFETRYARVRDQLRLLLSADQLPAWNTRHHQGRLALCDLISEQYPLAIFHGWIVLSLPRTRGRSGGSLKNAPASARVG